jgi:hypothetical protein
MKRITLGLLLAVMAIHAAHAQDMDSLNIQVHGYAAQGFLYTTHNNILTTQSSQGTAAWTEAVVNMTSAPNPQLRIGVQARYYLLGTQGNALIMDWAQMDYRASDHFGVRVGKVKTPWGLFNESQDIDPLFVWSLLPQSVYPILSRESYMTHYGGVVYGQVDLERMGAIEYRGFGGEGIYVGSDGIFLSQNEAGYKLPSGIQGPIFGGALHWKNAIPGLMLGYSDSTTTTWSAPITANGGQNVGTQTLHEMSQPNIFGKYEKKKFMMAAEWCRNWTNQVTQFPGDPVDSAAVTGRTDPREWYGMATYKLTKKLRAGVYDSEITDHAAPLGPARYQKDRNIAGRYDFNEFLYAKAEEHFIEGTQLNYDTASNPNGLSPNTRLTILKVGVSF